MVRDQQVGSGSNNRPQDGVEGRFRVGVIVKLPDKVSVGLHQNGVAAGLANKVVQGRYGGWRDFVPIGDCPEDAVHGFAQFDGGAQSLLGVAGMSISALSKMGCLL